MFLYFQALSLDESGRRRPRTNFVKTVLATPAPVILHGRLTVPRPYGLLAGRSTWRGWPKPFKPRAESAQSYPAKAQLLRHPWSLALIAFAFKADSLAPMISLKRWISRSRSCFSDLSAVPKNAQDPTLEPHAIMRPLAWSTKPHRAACPSSRDRLTVTKSVQLIA